MRLASPPLSSFRAAASLRATAMIDDARALPVELGAPARLVRAGAMLLDAARLFFPPS